MGILEADTIKQIEMKEKIKKEYLRRNRKLHETKLCSRNRIKEIYSSVPLVRYSEPFLKWTREELKQIDQTISKLMTIQKVLHSRDDVDRLYVSEKRKRKRTCQHWKLSWCIDTSTRRLHRKVRRRTDHSHPRQYWQYEQQQNDNN